MSGPELTARQARVLEIRNGEPKLNWAQIGERLGVPRSTASSVYYSAMRKIKKHGKDLGTQIPLNEGLLAPLEDKTLERQFAKFVKKLRGGVTNELFLGLLEKGLLKAHWILANDPTVFERLNAKELSLLISHLTETRQLLRGEPTKIISVEDRRHWDELSVALLQEVKRRGLDINLQSSQYHEVEPPAPDTERDTALTDLARLGQEYDAD